jgi:tyrosyl-tRNA synthetase
MHGSQLHGLTCPLLLTSDGRKMGKTASGAVWLDAARTSPYAFYQYWINVADDDVLMCLRFLTEIEREEYAHLEHAVSHEPHQRVAQKRLAAWLTNFVHGASGLASAEKATEVFFGAEIKDLSDAQLVEIFPDVPSAEVSIHELEQSIPVVDALVKVQLAKSKGDARRTVEQGGAYVNNRRVDLECVLGSKDLASDSVIVLRSGKKKFALLKVVR